MRLFSVKSATLDIDGAGLDYVRFGTGSKTLVLIPGLSFQGVKDAALPLAWMYRGFAKDCTVYVLDKKSVIPDNYTIRDLAADTARAMERLGLRAADVFGVSQGGMIAQALAIGRPDLVRKLALGVTASRPNEVMETAVGGWIQMAERRDYGAFVADMLQKLYSEDYAKKYRWLLPVLSRVGKPRDLRRFIALAKACLTCDTYPELSKITCPVFVIGGRRDKVATGAASEEIAAKLRCGIYLYERLGHAAYEEAGDFNRRVYQFFAE